MRNLIRAGRPLLLDMASTLFFLAVYLLSANIRLAVGLGIALGLAVIGWERARGRPVGALQWLSLVVVAASGSATLLTGDPRFVMLKPSLIYVVVGLVMLKRGWMIRYLPAIALELVPDIAVIFGFVWAGLMFFSAALNLVLAMSLNVAAWAAVMSGYGIASKLSLFLIQYATMRSIAIRRSRARPAARAIA